MNQVEFRQAPALAYRFAVAASLAASILVASCGGGGGGGGGDSAPPPQPPAAPTGVTATPGNQQLNLSWPAVTGATSYNVYSSLSDPVSVSGTQTSVSVAGATLSALTNGTPIYTAVTAVNANGESALSSQVCGVPTASTTAGLTLFDPLCNKTLDGQKWFTPVSSTGVS